MTDVKFDMTIDRAKEIFNLIAGKNEDISISQQELFNKLLVLLQTNEISVCELIESAYKLGRSTKKTKK